MIILDTNVISELVRVSPAFVVVDWLRQGPTAAYAITTVTVAELEHGIARLPVGAHQARLRARVDGLWQRYATRVVPFDDDAARAYAMVRSRREDMGRPITGFDAQIAAIALSRGARLATRNTKDFEDVGLEVLNPWDAPAQPPARAPLPDR